MLRLNDAEAEAAETQTWLEFTVECGYLSKADSELLFAEYDKILGKLVVMITNPKGWLIPPKNGRQT